MASGIYIILNTVSHKAYVGQASEFTNRWGTHRYDLRRQRHSCKYLQRAWNKYGENAFLFEVIEEVVNDDLTVQEQFWMDYLRFIGVILYNTAPAAGSCRGVKHSPEAIERRKQKRRGYSHSPETKAKISAAAKGRVMSDELRAKMSLRRKGVKKNYTPEELQRRSESRKGQKTSAEVKAKLSAAAKKRGPTSAESRAKMSASRTGMKRSAESIAKTIATKVERGLLKHSQESKEKNAAAHRGKKRSPEADAKRRATRIRNMEKASEEAQSKK